MGLHQCEFFIFSYYDLDLDGYGLTYFVSGRCCWVALLQLLLGGAGGHGGSAGAGRLTHVDGGRLAEGG